MTDREQQLTEALRQVLSIAHDAHATNRLGDIVRVVEATLSGALAPFPPIEKATP